MVSRVGLFVVIIRVRQGKRQQNLAINNTDDIISGRRRINMPKDQIQTGLDPTACSAVEGRRQAGRLS